MCRSLKDNTEEICTYFSRFGNDTKELIAYDIANNINKVGISVAGDSCQRFMKSNSSCEIDISKILIYIDSIKQNFDSESIQEIVKQMDADEREMRQITKGHFQTAFVINLIKHIVKEVSQSVVTISDCSLFALLVNCTPSCKIACREKQYISQKTNFALEYLTKKHK